MTKEGLPTSSPGFALLAWNAPNKNGPQCRRPSLGDVGDTHTLINVHLECTLLLRRYSIPERRSTDPEQTAAIQEQVQQES